MDVFTLAFRYLRTRAIAVVSLVFIALGVTVNVVVNAVMDGFRIRIVEHIRSVQSDLSLDFRAYTSRDHFRHAQETLDGMTEKRGGPIVAFAPRQREIGLVARLDSDGRFDVERKAPVFILGVDWDKERDVMPVDRMIDRVGPEKARLRLPENRKTDPFSDRTLPAALIGVQLAERLGLGRGDEFDLVVADLSRGASARTFEASNLRFEVAGCFDTGNDDYDGWNIYVSRTDFAKLRGDGPFRDCSTILARLKPGADAEAVKADLMSAYGDSGLVVRTWRDENRALLAAVNNERAMIVVILSFIILAAACSIMGILVMLVIEKTRDIGVLRSMGMSAGRTTAVFLVAGSTLGFFGVALGLLGGVAVVENLNAITTWLNRTFGIEVFNSQIYKFKEIPAALLPEWVIGTAVGAFLASVVASLIPAWLVSRLEPVKCLKHE
jgi:ABC-type lipoprotein release transport system permease subunit